PMRLLSHPRFRAAYDFLVLRAEVGDADQELADWWTQLQGTAPDQQHELLHANANPAPGRRRRRKKKQSA
ncbi:MAG TPA: polynucleotide adenylyltransferase PcnB, partial [Gammaproteobacteria bacterium]|nr:polynucleotide adenylyltransferase PcnB [Gammaproteobacteria bacterium]